MEKDMVTTSIGYYAYSLTPHTREIFFVSREEESQAAESQGRTVVLWHSLSDGVHHLPYCWGDQRADGLALVKGGKLVEYEAGHGDRTPYLTESEGKCVEDCKLYTSNQMVDAVVDSQEAEQLFWEMADQLGLSEEYRRLTANYSEGRDERIAAISRKIEAGIIRADADARAGQDPKGVLYRLLKHYRSGRNPLCSLRAEKGGIWTFHRTQPHPHDGADEYTIVYEGDDWWVTWTRKI